LYATKKQLQKELEKFMAGHLRRKALIQRLVPVSGRINKDEHAKPQRG
jgi:hypothetical protein